MNEEYYYKRDKIGYKQDAIKECTEDSQLYAFLFSIISSCCLKIFLSLDNASWLLGLLRSLPRSCSLN